MNGPVEVLGVNVELPVRLAVALPDFVYAAPAIRTMPAVRRYGDGRALELVVVEVGVEKVKHGFGAGYDLGYVQHCGFLLEVMFNVVTA